MKLSQHVLYAIDDAEAGKFDSALLHPCIGVDATARRLYPSELVGKRYISCIREYYWLLEPMIGGGINLVETKFTNISLKRNDSPDLAEIIFEIFRCSHAHGDEVPSSYSALQTDGPHGSRWRVAQGELHMPDRIIWALLAISVFAKVNISEVSSGDYYLSLGDEQFQICDWWGREDDFRPMAARHNQIRVKLENLWPQATDSDAANHR